jgi:hypothetical protein
VEKKGGAPCCADNGRHDAGGLPRSPTA